ncbi:MAG: hypothetical protein Q7S40_01145 [Opitutaceae bacterium]|nr:hypothetical protein [Opitutaceae bacterium]
MADDPDPPRKFYGFKPREFDRANPPPSPAADIPIQPDAGPQPMANTRIDVRELNQIASGAGSQFGTNAVGNRANEVHDMLQLNLDRDRAAGLFTVTATEDKKRKRRIRNYWTLLIIVDVPLGGFAALVGPGAAIPFVCAIAGVGMFTAWWTWENWFLRTD